MKLTYKELEKRLEEKQELIESLERNNERMDLILTDWIKDYGTKPNNRVNGLVKAAIDYVKYSEYLICENGGYENVR